MSTNNTIKIGGSNSGNITITTTITQDSYNKVEGSQMSEEMKLAFKELLAQIETGAKDLPEPQKEQLTQEVQVMTQAATEGKSGLSKFLTSSGKVMEFLGNAAGVAVTIGTAVAKIIGLF